MQDDYWLKLAILIALLMLFIVWFNQSPTMQQLYGPTSSYIPK